MAVKKVKMQCPYCGSTEFVRGFAGDTDYLGTSRRNKVVFSSETVLAARYTVQCQICRRCGSIVREFIAHPEHLSDY